MKIPFKEVDWIRNYSEAKEMKQLTFVCSMGLEGENIANSKSSIVKYENKKSVKALISF